MSDTTSIRQVFGLVDPATGLMHPAQDVTVDMDAYAQLANVLTQQEGALKGDKGDKGDPGVLDPTVLNKPNGVAGLDATGKVTVPVLGDVSSAAVGTTNTVSGVALKASKALAAQDDVSRRAPTPQDDSTRGRAVGHLWNLPDTRQMWRCRDATPGLAIWEPVPTGILPLDAVPGVTLHGYGTRRMSASFSGSAAVQVSFAGIAPVDLPFGSDDNVDTRSLALLSGAVTQPNEQTSPQMWGVAVLKWYDQSPATTKYDLTVPTNSVSPWISLLGTTAGSPYIAFADGGLNWLTDRDGYVVNIQHPRLFNSSVAASSTNLSVVMLVRGGPIGGTLETPVCFSDTYPISINTQDVTLTDPLYAPASVGVGAENSLGFFTPSSPCVFGVNFSSTAVTAFVDDLSSASIGPMPGDNTAGGLYVGGSSPTNGGYGVRLNCVIYGPAMTDEQMLAIRMAVTDTYQLTPQVQTRVVGLGASTEAGADGWLCRTPVGIAVESLKSPAVFYNFSIGGSGFVHAATTPVNGMNEIWAKGAKTVYTPYAPNVYVTGEGSFINQVGGGTTVADTISYYKTWAALPRALGANVRILSQTVAPAAAVSDASVRAQINAGIKAATASWDYLSDTSASPVLGDPGIMNSRVWTVTGGGHRSPYYQSLQATLVLSGLRTLLEGQVSL